MKTDYQREKGSVSTGKKAGKVFWGLLIIGAAVLLLLNAIFPDETIPAIRILGSVLLLAVSFASLTKFKFVLFFLPLAIIAYIWRTSEFLAFMAGVDLWLLLLVAVLLGIGLSVIFHRKTHIHVNINGSASASSTEETLNTDEYVDIDVSWGDHIKYVHADNLKRAKIKTSFAAAKVYFDSCQASPEGLDITINCSFSELTLNLPRNWEINNQISTFAGEVKSMPPMRSDNMVKVNLIGNVNFAELKINYV